MYIYMHCNIMNFLFVSNHFLIAIVLLVEFKIN